MSRLVHIARMRARLERAHWPRLQMATVVAITGGVGFVASYVLLRGGMDAMWQRYPLAVAIAYAVFLLLLWLWARFFERKAYDWLDLVPDGGDGGGSGSPGGGGHSGGGGASASFEVEGNVPMPSIAAPDVDVSLPKLELPDALGGADEGGCVLVLLLLVAAVALSALLFTVGWVVWIAPTLMAELILDVALAGSLYRRLRRIQTQHWLRTALRRTIWPVLGVALTLAVLGYAGTRYAPGADSVGDVVAAMRARE